MPNVQSQHKGGGLWPPAQRGRLSAALCGFVCAGSEHWAYLVVETQDMLLVESPSICLVETQDMCCVDS